MVRDTKSYRLFRFSVGSLLIVITLVAMCFGFAHWRRQQTFASYRQIHDEGVGLIMVEDQSGWAARLGLGKFWTSYPRTAEVYVTQTDDSEYKIGHEVFAWNDLETKLLDIKNQLQQLGISDIQIWSYQRPVYAPPDGVDLRSWKIELSNRQPLKFGSENGMAGGGMSSPQEIEERWNQLAPKK